MKSNKSANYIFLGLLVIISFGIYINALQGAFLVDDYAVLLSDSRIHDIKTYFSRHFSMKIGALQEVVYALLWHVSKGNTWHFHFFDILVHVGCVVLIFILCNVLFKDANFSFLCSLIFAVHPIHTEAVSWISGNPYALSSLFFIAAMICYIKSDESILYLTLTAVFFSLCFFAGNSLAALPLMFVMYDLFFRKKKEGHAHKIRLSVLFLFLIVALLFIITAFYSRNKFMRLIFYYRGTSYLVVAAKALVYYLKILYLPLHRGLYHPFAFNTMDIQEISPLFFTSLAVLVISAYAFFKYRRRFPTVSFGIMWFFVTFLPYSNILPTCNIVSERYLYLPSLGFAMVMAALFLKVWEIINRGIFLRKFLRLCAVMTITAFLGSYAVLTIGRNYEYNNLIFYWKSNINNFPDGYIVYNSLAGTCYRLGNIEGAKAYCWVNLMINPRQPHVWCNLGKIYREQRDFKTAEYCYREAVRIDKEYFPALKALSEIEKESVKKK